MKLLSLESVKDSTASLESIQARCRIIYLSILGAYFASLGTEIHRYPKVSSFYLVLFLICFTFLEVCGSFSESQLSLEARALITFNA